MFMEMMGIKPTGNKMADTAIGAGMDPMNWFLAMLASRAHLKSDMARKALDALGDAPEMQSLLNRSTDARNDLLRLLGVSNAVAAPLRPFIADMADDEEEEQEPPKIDTKQFYGDPGMLMPRERLRRKYRDQYGIDTSEGVEV